MKLLKVFVKGPPYRAITEAIFTPERGYQVSASLSDADAVVWTGGEDINPVIYGEKPIPKTSFSDRDKSDLSILDFAYDKGKTLIGICRGAQLLNCAPNGGKLWQDVDNHEYGIHDVFDCVTGQWGNLTNSIHHQMMRPGPDAQVLAWAEESTFRESQDEIWQDDIQSVGDSEKDIECIWYPKTKSFCFQAHPEFGHPATTDFFFKQLNLCLKGIEYGSTTKAA
jgi:gamma-glutamyl-gamma-aminobutyrate hydrolase PuuD